MNPFSAFKKGLSAFLLISVLTSNTFAQNITGRWQLEGVRLHVTYSIKSGVLRVSQPRSAYKAAPGSIEAEFLPNGTVYVDGHEGTYRQQGDVLLMTINGKMEKSRISRNADRLTISTFNQVASLAERERKNLAVMMVQQAKLMDQFPGLRETESVSELIMGTEYRYLGGGVEEQQVTSQVYTPAPQYRERIIPAKGKPKITVFSTDNNMLFRLYVNGEPASKEPSSRISAAVPRTKRIYVKVVPEEGEAVEEELKRQTDYSYTFAFKIKKKKNKLVLEGQEFVGQQTVRELVEPAVTSVPAGAQAVSPQCRVTDRDMAGIKTSMGSSL